MKVVRFSEFLCTFSVLTFDWLRQVFGMLISCALECYLHVHVHVHLFSHEGGSCVSCLYSYPHYYITVVIGIDFSFNVPS